MSSFYFDSRCHSAEEYSFLSCCSLYSPVTKCDQILRFSRPRQTPTHSRGFSNVEDAIRARHKVFAAVHISDED